MSEWDKYFRSAKREQEHPDWKEFRTVEKHGRIGSLVRFKLNPSRKSVGNGRYLWVCCYCDFIHDVSSYGVTDNQIRLVYNLRAIRFHRKLHCDCEGV